MKWLPDCLATVTNSAVPISIIVIDNNSTDETVPFIKHNYNNIILIEQQVNLGFGKANNIGMSYALKKEADYVFLLNQDTRIQFDTLEKLVSVADKNPEYGIISPLQLDYSGSSLEECFYFFMSENNKTFYSDAVVGNTIKELYKVSFIQAAAWLLPRKTLLTVGGFDPIFYHYGEDNNYCQRTLFHGLKIGVCPFTSIQHDSTAKLMVEEPLFSERYFKNYHLSVLKKYCNINNDIGKKEMLYEIKKNQKSSFKSFFKCNIVHAKGYFKKAKILKNLRFSILESRKNNLSKQPNYL